MRETKLERVERVLHDAAKKAQEQGLVIVYAAHDCIDYGDAVYACDLLGALDHVTEFKVINLHLTTEQYDAIEYGFDAERKAARKEARKPGRTKPWPWSYFFIGLRLRRRLMPVFCNDDAAIVAAQGVTDA